MAVEAKYDGRCLVCEKAIQVGEPIHRVSLAWGPITQRGWAHEAHAPRLAPGGNGGGREPPAPASPRPGQPRNRKGP